MKSTSSPHSANIRPTVSFGGIFLLRRRLLLTGDFVSILRRLETCKRPGLMETPGFTLYKKFGGRFQSVFNILISSGPLMATAWYGDHA